MEVQAEVNFPIIKTSIDTVLSSCLNKYTKPQLLSISRNLKLEVKQSWKKDRFVQILTETILTQFKQFYKPLIEDILEKFRDQLEQAIGFEDSTQLEVLAPLINKGFFYVFQQENLSVLVVPDEIWSELFKSEGAFEEVTIEIDSENFVQEDENTDDNHPAYELLSQWQQQALKIYGKASSEHFSEIWNRHFSEKLTVEQINEILNP